MARVRRAVSATGSRARNATYTAAPRKDGALARSTLPSSADCGCGSADCRGRVSGEDWRSPALWLCYEGYFSPYLALRIAKLKGLRRAS